MQEYLDSARANNPVSQENQNLSAIAALEVDKAKAMYYLPEVSASGNFLYAPVVKGVGYEEAITNGALYSAQLNINMPLFTRRKVEAQMKNSAVNQEAYRNNIELSQHDLDRQVTEQYILTWQNLERIAATQRLLDILSEQEKVVRVFAENAILSQSDVLFFTIEKENKQLALQDFQAAYRQGLARLNLLCGRVDTAYAELPPPDIHLNRDTAGLSNFLKAYQLDSLLAASNQEMSELKYYPQVSFTADCGLNAIMLKDIYKKLGFSAGINFSMPIFDGHQRNMARQQINLLDTKIVAVQRQLADFEELLKFYRERIARGELSVNDYMNTIKSYAELQLGLISLRTSRLLLVNDYNYWNW